MIDHSVSPDSRETLTLAMLEQRIAEMEPWAYTTIGSRYCVFCKAWAHEQHRGDCTWQTCRAAKYREAIRDTPDWRSYAPKDHEANVKGMWWAKPADWELFQNGKGRCSVWLNGTWHTWDKNGTGGENSREDSVEGAKAAAEHAIVRQGWGKFEASK